MTQLRVESRYGYRKADSLIAHLPCWMGGGGSGTSVCGRAKWNDSDIWPADAQFDPDGSLRLCSFCAKTIKRMAWARLGILAAWGVGVALEMEDEVSDGT